MPIAPWGDGQYEPQLPFLENGDNCSAHLQERGSGVGDVAAPTPGHTHRPVAAWGPGIAKQDLPWADLLIQEPGPGGVSPGLSQSQGRLRAQAPSWRRGEGRPLWVPCSPGRGSWAGGRHSPSAAASCLQSSRMSWAEARDPHMYRPITIALVMRFLQQLTGITPILVYLQSIFDSTAVLLVRAPPPRRPTPPPASREAAPP